MTVQSPAVAARAADAAEAAQFIRAFHAEHPAAGPAGQRLSEVLEAIHITGTYRHTPAELAYACRVAWRNSSRCIGRLYWQSLRVRDRRDITSAAEVAAECVTHLREATNGGRIRPLITVLAPDAPGRPGPRIRQSQLIRYAGYPRRDGTVTGDPLNTGITELAHRLGWAGSGGRFDVLPLIIQAAGEGPQIFAIPPDAVLEVPLTHPSYPWFADLGLRWHAVPVISDMFLTAGGIRYPCAPFNGWYMGTEVGSRNLGDTGRYNKCPTIARHMGLNMSSERSLWRDRALVELNTAVLHSFDQAGVTVTDHHTESERFLTHLRREERAGRMCPADWSWIVPPLAGSACGVFHRYYDNPDLRPGFYRHPPTPMPYPQSEDA